MGMWDAPDNKRSWRENLADTGHEFNSGIGALVGMASTRSLPKHLPGGQMQFIGGDEGSPPRAMGDALIAPNEESLTPRTMEHEGEHRNQSKRDGFSYLVNSALGGEYGPYEEGAYRAESPYAGPEPERDEITSATGDVFNPVNRDWAAQNPDYADAEATKAMLDKIRLERGGR